MSLGRIYISGKISGLGKEEVRTKFAEAAKRLSALGYAPVSPLDNGIPEDAPWEAHMAADLCMLLCCGSVYMLKDWQDSLGARVEYHMALMYGKAVLFERPSAMDCIVKAVEDVFGVQLYQLRGKDRKGGLVMARIALAGVASSLGFSSREIGLELRRDRSTIIYYTHQYDNMMKHSTGFRRRVEEVLGKVTKNNCNESGTDKHRI